LAWRIKALVGTSRELSWKILSSVIVSGARGVRRRSLFFYPPRHEAVGRRLRMRWEIHGRVNRGLVIRYPIRKRIGVSMDISLERVSAEVPDEFLALL
jgi:hypothetical protein